MGHEWERDEIERWFCFASEASACCVEEGPRAELGHGGFGLASEASLCCIGQLTRTAPETHGQLRRTVPEWGPKSYAPVKPDNVQIQFNSQIFFFWPKEGRKKRENNSIVNTKKNVSPGGVGFFSSGQFWLFLFKKIAFFFNLQPTPRRARANRGWKWEKIDFFWELEKLVTGTPVAF